MIPNGSTRAKVLTTVLFFGVSTLAVADTATGVKALSDKDYATAYRELKASADRGDSNAQSSLAIMYSKGLGIERDMPQAMRLWQLAAAKGNSQAELFLGLTYARGWGVRQNYAEASHWYQMAAD